MMPAHLPPFRPALLLSLLLCAGLGAAHAAPPAKAPRAQATTAADSPQDANSLSSPQLLLEMLLSEIAYSRGQVGDALAGYNDLTQRSNDPRIQRRANEIATTSVLLNAAKRPAEAEAAVRAALARQDGPARANLLLQLPAIFGRSTDKRAGADTVFRLTEGYLDRPEALIARAQSALDAGQGERAREAAASALKLQPDSERAALLNARSAAPAQQREAMQALGEFARQHPDAIEARLDWSRWLAEDGQPAAAAAEYNRLLADHPGNDALAFAIVGISAQAGDLDTAIRLLEKLIDHGWGDTNQLYLLLGEAQEESDHHDAALAAMAKVGPGPHYTRAQIRRAQLLTATGKADEGIALLRNAAREDRAELTPLQATQALLQRQAGHPEEALELWRVILAREPDNIDALYSAALVAEQLGQAEEMERNLRHLIKLEPEHAHALNALGYAFADRNQHLDEAETLIARALKLAPDDGAILDSMGWLRFRQGRLPEALDYLQRAFQQLQDSEIAGHLVEVLAATGKQGEARAMYQEALKADPKNTALRALGKRLGF